VNYAIAGLAIVVLLIVRVLLSRNHDSRSLIDLDDLLIGDDGKLSKAAVVLFGAFTIASWVIIFQAWKGVLTDINFAAYLGAFVAPTITKLWKSSNDNDKSVG